MNSRASNLTHVATRSRLAALDGWRAVACLLVIFHHTGFTLRWGPFLVWGFTGVHLFFVLSGYLLFRPFCRAIIVGAPFNFADFYIRRFLRIYPPYLLSLMVFTIVRYAMKMHPPSTHNFVAHLLLAFNSSDYHEFFGINGVFWTLAIEMQFYLILPIVAFLLDRALKGAPFLAIYGTALLFLVVGLSSRAVELWFTTGPNAPAEGAIRFHTIFSYLDLFGCGMSVAAFTCEDSKTNNLGRSANWLLVVGGMGLFLFANIWCTWATGRGDWLEFNVPWFLWGFPPVLCTGIAMILFVVVRGSSFLAALLTIRPLVYIGQISYSIYLFHSLVQMPMFKIVPLNFMHNYSLQTFCWGFISLGPALLLATGVYYLVEAPSLRLAEHFKNRNAKLNSVTGATLVSANRNRVLP